MTKKVILLALVAFFCQMAVIPVFAVKAYPLPITITQPDGSQLTIHLHGDEYRHIQTTEDGYLLKANAQGFLTYATVSAKGELVESSIVAQNVSKRSTTEIQFLKTIDKSASLQVLKNNLQKSKMLSNGVNQPLKVYPLIGAPKALVILVNFTDKSFVVPSPQVAFQNLVSQTGYSANGGTGSAKDYFMSASYGKFAPDFVVAGPVTLPQNMAYYGGNDSSGNDKNPAQMVLDACAALAKNGFDFTPYDTDNNGVIDNVFIYYAGYNEAEGGPANTIWPHRWSITDAGLTSGIYSGKTVNDYSCTSELKGNTGSNMCGVGTFCHEFGHVLGLPDYYDTSGSSTYITTLETWEIMDYGPYLNGGNTPPTYSVWDRFFLGYLTPQQINASADITLQPIYQGTIQPANTNNQAFLLASISHNLNGAAPSPSEFFLIEYRKHTGWDTYLGQATNSIGTNLNIPADGMCVWHIDYDQTAWNNNTPNNYTGSTQTLASHMRVYLQPLSGQTTTPGTTFTTGSYNPTTWAGIDINRGLSNITTTPSNITFKFMAPKMVTTGIFSPFSTTLGTTSAVQSITLSALNLNANLSVGLQNGTNYEIKLSTDALWSKSLLITPTSGTVNTVLQVRLNPNTVGSITDILDISAAGLTTTNYNLTGTCTIGTNSPQIFTGRIDNTLLFSSTKLNVMNSKTINIKTTDLNNSLNVIVGGADAAMYSVSVASVTKDTANAITGTNITVTFTPTSTGVHTATLTISGGGLSPDRIITLTGTGI